MFWRRAPLPTPTPAPRASDPAAEINEGALETIGVVFHAFGEHALEVPDVPPEQVARVFDAWSRHLLLGTPHPLHEHEGPARERDWAGARQFFRSHRKRESEHASRALAELRSLIWSFFDRMARNLPEETRFEEATRGQMHRLRSAVDKSSIDEIKKEALSAVAFLERAIQERNEKRSAEIEALSHRIDSLRVQLDDVRQESETDPLTRLLNRRAFDLQVEHAVVMSMLLGQQNSMIIVDLDHFKTINDTHGHPGGDAVLCAIAKRMVQTFPRKMDCVARFGGEEFAILLRESGLADAARLAERFLAELRRLEIDFGTQKIQVTASAGVSQLIAGEESADWIARTDAALYRAKAQGRDRSITSLEAAPS